MRFLILGPLEVRGERGPVALGGAKPRAALAVLLLHRNQPVSAERLALALWGEDAPAGATKTVQVHISRLRKALDDPEVIVTSAAGYCLRVRPGELDAAEFERLAADGRQALAGGQADRAAGLLRDALKLWRGAPLADLAFDTFHAAEVAQLEERRLSALETRIEADLESGRQAAQLIAELRQLVAANPTRERFAAQLMLALYRCGRQTEALETYRDARRSLLAEIGVEPGPWLRELEASILRQDVALDPGAVVAEIPPELDTSTAPPLVGRDDEIAWLHLRWERARGGAGGLLIVAGPRGSGKSRIVAQLAGDVHRRGDAVLYADGATPGTTAAALLLGLPDADRPTLVVLDEADRLGDDGTRQLASTSAGLGPLPVLVLVCCGDPDALAGVQCDGVLALEPLGTEAVRAIAGRYATSTPNEEIPAGWLHEASAGLPRRVHEVASQWARREAARRVSAVAGRAADERAQLRTIQEELVGEVAGLQEASVRALPRRADRAEVACPFKGLASYESADAGYFFGRERLVAELVARLVGANLLAVVGASGSGKSSVVRAGLLPALASGVLPQSEQWSQVLMRPGEHPLGELDALLAGQDPDGHVVIAVDQFEELFTVCADEDERSEFVGALVASAADPGDRYTVVLALRADHYGRCAAYPELSSLLAANHVLVRSMQRDELRRAVEGPCERSGLRIEQELVDALVTDVEREPGGLPLLSSALLELWERRDGRRLRLATYEQIGGVRGAVARLAEEAYGRLDESGRVAAQRVLLRLVGAGGDGAVERRRVELAELETSDHDDAAGVVAVLIDRRLLTVDERTVEIAHEALLREWPRLHDWIQEDLDGLRIQRAVSAAADEWDRLGRDDGALLRGSRLTEAIELRDASRVVLNERERGFLAAGETAREGERITRRRRTRVVLAASGTLLLACVAVTLTALFAARDGAIAASRDLAARSVTLLESDPETGLAIARLALARHDTPDAEDALRQAVFGDRATAVVQASSTGSTYVAAPTRDGRRVVTAGADGSVRVWQLGGKPVGRILTTYGSPAYAAALSPDGKFVGSVAQDGEVGLTPIDGGVTRRLFRLPGREQSYSISGGPGGFVIGTTHGLVRVIPTLPGAAPYVLGRHTTAATQVWTVAFNPAGTKVVSGGDDGHAYIWDVSSRSSIRLDPGGTVYGARFSPNGRSVATVGSDGDLRLWDTASGAPVGRPLKISDETLSSVGFSADGERVVTTSEHGVIAVTDLRSGRLLTQIQSGIAASAAFVPASDQIVTADDDGTLRFWTPLAVRALFTKATDPSFSPDGARVLGSGSDGVQVWDLANGSDVRLPGRSPAVFAPDGREIITSTAPPAVLLYDVSTGRARRVPLRAVPAFGVQAVAFSRLGRIAVGGSNGVGKWAIYVTNADGGGLVTLLGHKAGVNGLAFSPDGGHLASASDDGTVRLWNLRTGRTDRVIEADPSGVRDVAFSADGTRLVMADTDATVGIWPVAGGRPISLVGHVGPVNTASFNDAGNRVVSTGTDGTVRVWNAAGGATLVVLRRDPMGASEGAEFSPDGSSVVSAGTDGTFVTPCEVCGSLAEVERAGATRAAPALSPSELQRLGDPGP